MTENDSYKAGIKDLCNNFHSELADCGLFGDEYIKKKQRQTDEKIMPLLKYQKPKIMVYGIYNSGKSTLVNAICKKAVAEVADRPMTDCIAEYDAGKYILVDSPGVNAPVQHEEIADRHLEGCHMVLFVISSKGMFEDRVNYQKMGNLIKKGLPFYIILNERAVQLPPKEKAEERKKAKAKYEEEQNAIERKIIKNLRVFSGVADVEKKYEVVKVNAKRAWEGIEKDKKAFVDASKISVLLGRIDSILEGRGALKQLLAPLSAIEYMIGETEKDMIANTGNEDYAVRREILQTKIMNFREDFLAGIRDIAEKYFDVLYNRALGKTGAGMGHIQDELCMDVEADYKVRISSVVRYMREAFPEIHLEPGNVCNLEGVAFRMEGEMPVQVGSAKSHKEAEQIHIKKEEDSTDIVPEVLKTVGTVNRFANPVNSIVPAPVEVYLLESIFSFFRNKNKAEKEERELRERAEKNNARVLEQVEEDIRRRKEARTYASAKIDEMASEIRTRLQDSMDKEFGRIIDRLDQIIEEKDKKDSAARRFLNRCKEFRKQITEIRKEIG